MLIYAYRVRQDGGRSLRDLAQLIEARPIGQRFYAGAPNGMRLDEANLAGDHVLLNFAKPRGGHGPGSMADDEPLADIELGERRRFGEDSAVAFDPALGFAAIQFNQYGPRVSHIQEYLAAADLDAGVPHGLQPGFTFAPHYKTDAAARLRDMHLVKEIEFTISVPGVNAADYDAGASVGGILRSNLPGGIETISVTLKAGRSREEALALDAARTIIADLQRLGGDLKAATVVGRQDPRAQKDKVNLVDERLSRQATIRPTRGHRMALPERFQALSDTLRMWQAADKLR